MMLSCSTNLILIIFTHPTSSQRIFAISSILARERLAKKIKCLLPSRKKKLKKKKSISCTSSNFLQKKYTQKLFIIFSHLDYTTLSTIYSHVYASWHTPECEGKSAANEFKAFLF
jgi:hypothetical protein